MVLKLKKLLDRNYWTFSSNTSTKVKDSRQNQTWQVIQGSKNHCQLLKLEVAI